MRVSYLTVCCNDIDLLTRRLHEVGPHVDQVVVVHDGPDAHGCAGAVHGTDCLFLVAPFEGYCEPQRRRGLRLCEGDWVLVGDTDEEFLPGFLADLKKHVAFHEHAGADGVLLGREERVMDDKPVTRHLRLFRRDGKHFSDIIHQGVQGVVRIAEATGVQLIHHSATDGRGGNQELSLRKNRRYAAAQKRLREKYRDRPDVLALPELNIAYRIE